MRLTNKQVLALRRLRGEKNLTITELAKELDINIYTAKKALVNVNANLNPTTVNKINNWIIDQYTPTNSLSEVQA